MMSLSLDILSQAGFVDLAEYCPGIEVEAVYAGPDNFTGDVVPGYLAPKAFMAQAPAQALCRVQEDARRRGLTLRVYDAYRPAKAVASFVEWARLPETNPHVKELFYPTFTRQQLFEQGFIAARSSHSRGSAIDLTLADPQTGLALDMGTRFDFFHVRSHTDDRSITAAQRRNRQLLKTLMEGRGFRNYSKEWWHYSFRPEPFPDTFFDFDVE